MKKSELRRVIKEVLLSENEVYDLMNDLSGVDEAFEEVTFEIEDWLGKSGFKKEYNEFKKAVSKTNKTFVALHKILKKVAAQEAVDELP
jgi:hypothetical protein